MECAVQALRDGAGVAIKATPSVLHHGAHAPAARWRGGVACHGATWRKLGKLSVCDSAAVKGGG